MFTPRGSPGSLRRLVPRVEDEDRRSPPTEECVINAQKERMDGRTGILVSLLVWELTGKFTKAFFLWVWKEMERIRSSSRKGAGGEGGGG